jgi:hypothetical protein
MVGLDGQFIEAIELVRPDAATAKEYAKQLIDGRD